MITQAARIIRVFTLTITMLGLASACTSNPVSTAGATSSSGRVAVRSDVGEKAAAVAVDQLGVPYRYGGSSPSGFDCSGLVQYSYSQVGKQLPRTTGQLWTSTRSVERHELRTGDLLFFRIDGKMSHVGLYLDGQRFVHAPSTGRKVSVATLDSPFYKAAFTRAGRPR